MKKITIIIIVLLASIFKIYAESPEASFVMANSAYSAGEFSKAIGLYEEIVDGGNASPVIYYNLGNAYFREANYPLAILNYERAKKLNPGDEDINFNLKIANLKIVDKIEPVAKPFYISWGESMRDWMPASSWAWITVVLFWISAGFMAGFFYISNSNGKKLTFFASIAVFMFCMVCLFTAYQAERASNDHSEAIVTALSVYAKNSPDAGSMDIFILHEGTKVRILDELNNWQKIKLENGAVGWMPKKTIERI